MLNALLIANARSGAAGRLADVDVPGRWVLDPSAVTGEDVAGADLLAFFAGDGTVQVTLSQLLRTLPVEALPPVAMLPFGTTNMNAKDINHRQRRRAAAASLTRVIRTGRFEPLTRSLLRIEDGVRVEHGFFFGMGVIAEVVARWHAERGAATATNQIRMVRAMASALTGISALHAVDLYGQPTTVYGLLATTLDRLLLGSRPFWGGGRPGDLRVTWIDANAKHLLRRAPALLRGNAGLEHVPGYESRAPDHLTLSFTGPYILDGEIFHPNGQSLTIQRSEPVTWIAL
ncbi:MAG: diacylglycerol kinase family protein [Pseudomonadales bacterium]